METEQPEAVAIAGPRMDGLPEQAATELARKDTTQLEARIKTLPNIDSIVSYILCIYGYVYLYI